MKPVTHHLVLRLNHEYQMQGRVERQVRIQVNDRTTESRDEIVNLILSQMRASAQDRLWDPL